MSKTFKIILFSLLSVMLAVGAYAGIRDRFSGIELYGEPSNQGNFAYIPEISAPSGTPTSNSGWLYVKDKSGTSALYFEDDAGSVVQLGTGSATALDDIGNPDANTSIDLTDYYITLDSGDTDHDLFNLQGTGAFGDISVLRVEQITGNATDGTVLEVVAADANVDPLVVSSSGKANALVVGQNTGVVTIAGVADGTDALVLTAGDISLTDGNLVLDSGNVDISGNLILDNGLTIDNNVNNVLELNENSEELKLTFTTNVIDLSSTSGVDQIDFFDNAAAVLTHAANGAADDFTISQTGAQDSSLVLSSAGTGADALQVTTSAGGIDIAVVGSAAGEDLDLDSDSSINITASEAGVADAVVISTDGAGSGIDITSLADIDITTTGAAGEDITLLNTGGSVIAQGTEAAADAIRLYASDAAGGIDIDYGTGNMVITGTGASADFTLDADLISIDGTGTSNIQFTNGAAEDVTIGTLGAADHSLIVSASGTAADAMQITTSAGGIDITDGGAAGGEDLDISATNASVNISAAEDVADAIVINSSTGGIDITADGAAASDLDLTCTNGSTNISGGEAAADAVTIAAGAGGVDISSAATYDIDLTATGGTVQVIATEAAANQFKVDAQGTVAGYGIVLETTDGGVQINADGAANGDISVDAADDLNLISAGDTTFAVTGTLSMGNTAVTSADMDYEAVSAANVIAETEGNKVFFIGDATEFASTLPDAASSAGMHIVFIVTAAPVGASYTIVTEASENTIIGGVVERETDTGDDGPYLTAADTVTFVDSIAVVGDMVEFWCDGTNWYMDGQVNADGALTIIQAS